MAGLDRNGWPICVGIRTSKADTIIYELNYVFSGDTPAGSAPWARLNFTDVSGGVQLKVESLLTSPQFVGTDGVLFNLDPTLNPGNLIFTYQSGLEALSIGKNVDAFKADGDGKFDIRLVWETSAGPDRFDDTDSVIYLIGGISGLDVDEFLFKSTTSGGEGIYYAAAHIQSIPGADSGWIGSQAPIPEPATMILLGSGLIGLAGYGRKKFFKK